MNSESRTANAGRLLAAAAVLALGGAAVAGGFRVPGNPPQATISIVRRVDLGYYLVTGAKPFEFDAAGPTWLRVYTRLWWPSGRTGSQHYQLSLWQEDAARPVRFDVALSPTSYGPQGHKLGQWRSFYIQAPAGPNHYKLVLDQAPGDTVGVRVAEEAPRPYLDVPVADAGPLTVVEGKDTSHFYRLERASQVRLALEGPCRVLVHARLSFDPRMNGVQPFELAVVDAQGPVAKLATRAGRSAAALYVEEPSLLPSNERTLRFSLPGGHHELTFSLAGTLAGSAAIRVTTMTGDKYE